MEVARGWKEEGMEGGGDGSGEGTTKGYPVEVVVDDEVLGQILDGRLGGECSGTGQGTESTGRARRVQAGHGEYGRVRRVQAGHEGLTLVNSVCVHETLESAIFRLFQSLMTNGMPFSVTSLVRGRTHSSTSTCT